MNSTAKKTGFTLPEVLITLMIIGVVASITLPNIIADLNKKDLANLEKKQDILCRTH